MSIRRPIFCRNGGRGKLVPDLPNHKRKLTFEFSRLNSERELCVSWSDQIFDIHNVSFNFLSRIFKLTYTIKLEQLSLWKMLAVIRKTESMNKTRVS